MDHPEARRQVLRVDRFPTPEAVRDFFKERYGPTIAVFRSLADSPERAAQLDDDLAGLVRRFDLGGGVLEWEYLLLTARRASCSSRGSAG